MDVCPPSTQLAACNRITAAKHIVIYHDLGHVARLGETDRTFNFLLRP